MERGPISFSENSEKLYNPSTQELKGRELSYRFDELRNQKIELELEYEKAK